MKTNKMKLRFLVYLILLVLQSRMLNATLQGPKLTTTTTTASETSEDLNKSKETPISTNHEDSQTQTTTTKTETDSESSNSKPVTTENGNSNDRKSSKYVAEKASLSNGLDTNLSQRSKILQAAIFEQLLNDKMLKQKLQDQIENIEARRSPNEILDPTPEEIEAHSMYEKAIEMLTKPRSDKRVAYTLIRKAAEMKHAKARAELAWAHLMGHWIEFNFEFAAAEFDDLAKEGVPEAHMGLAYLHLVGVGGKNISQPLSLIHLTLAALGDHTFAQMALGYRYSYGINVPISCERSLSFYKKVAKKVASKITFSNGPIVHRVRLLDESENPGSQEAEIVDYYQLLADKGDVQSQVGLGQLYYQGGKAIQQDHQKALEYFTQAANAGNAIGYAFLGKLYLEGSDYIKADNETALKYFKKAADLGDPVGQSGLGLMYLKGLGVPRDPMKALNYFTQAADQGWVDGQLQLGNMYFTGTGVKTDYKLALKYFQLASQSGHVLAYYNLGVMNAHGMGIMRSCSTAVEFFKTVSERGRWSQQLMHAYSDYKDNRIDEAYMQYALLAEMGYEVAQGNAAYLLDRGDVTVFHDRHEDLIRAFYYWKRAAAQGYSAAQVKLGDYYYYGWGTGVDFETAAALYRKASEQQYNAQAMFNLGYMHEQGLGMKKDWHLAKRLYDLAAETNADAKVPVAIALLKLQVLAKMEAIKESPYKFIFYMDENIAANWDLYMITILTLLLGFIMYTRRPYQNQQNNAAPAAQVIDNNPPRPQTEPETPASTASGNDVNNPTSTNETSSITTKDDSAPSTSNSSGAAITPTPTPTTTPTTIAPTPTTSSSNVTIRPSTSASAKPPSPLASTADPTE